MTTYEPTRPKSWRDRANTIGYINGGTEGQAAMLREALKGLPCSRKSVLTWANAAGKQISAVCEDLCKNQLSPCGIVERSGTDQWRVSKEVKDWLANDDPFYLAGYLHANVKFFGELLDAIDQNTTQADLLEIAKTTYALSWTSVDQIRRRTGWLRSLGMLELWGTKVVRTSSGDRLLSQLQLCSPDEARGMRSEGPSADIEDASLLELLSSVADIDQEALRKRRPLIGYIPRGAKSSSRDADDSALTPTTAARKLIEVIGAGMGVEEFRDACTAELGISQSSFYSVLHSSRHMGLLEQTAFNFFEPAPNAHELTAVGNETMLVASLHGRFSFFGEILRHLDSPSATSQLVRIAREHYGYSQASNGEIRTRLGFLQDAGLVDRIDWQRFRVTSAGKIFASHLTLQNEKSANEQEGGNDSITDKREIDHFLSSIIEDLRKFSKDGSESKAFENAVSRAFGYLGFSAEHLGGPGRTDVIIVAELAPGDRYRVIADAKSSGNGTVAESSVNFDILREHKRKHKADYVVVVGPDFANRLKDWAVDNKVTLLQVDDLVTILERHSVNPISLVDFRDTFARIDTHRDEMFERYQLLERRSSLIAKILQIVFQEAVDEDPIAAGFVSLENITYALRKEFSPRPSAEEISESLSFLSNPVVAALETSKDRYKLVDSPHNISLRLQGLGNSVQVSYN